MGYSLMIVHHSWLTPSLDAALLAKKEKPNHV